VTGPAVPVTQDGQEPGVAGIVGTGIGRAAALIAGLTILARLLGLVRTLVFAKTVGATCLGTAYVTANALPRAGPQPTLRPPTRSGRSPRRC
jgi:hypothetical protein